MGKSKSYTSSLLKINLSEDKSDIHINWAGKSIDREPGKFITPILMEAIKKSSERDKRIIMDFCKLEYMNSSTITPLTKILERARRGTTSISVLYKKALKWQDLSFSALSIFQTKDLRVEIKGI